MLVLVQYVLSTNRGTVIEYASCALSTPERNYEKECLGIVWAVNKCHCLVGAHFTLERDHKLQLWLETAKNSHACSQRVERWSLELGHMTLTLFTSQVCQIKMPMLSNRVGLPPPPLETCDSAQAQRLDPVLLNVTECLEVNAPFPTS